MSTPLPIIIPHGYCHCGCGEKTKIASRSDTFAKMVKGEPMRFLNGHRARLDRKSQDLYIIEDRGYETPCWIWQRSRANGYGRMYHEGRLQQAHRVFYERKYGPIPDGLQLDHKCRNHPCVNPDHTAPISNAENTRIGSAAKLSREKVAEIFLLRSTGMYQAEIAARLGVHNCTVSRVLTGQRWAQ